MLFDKIDLPDSEKRECIEKCEKGKMDSKGLHIYTKAGMIGMIGYMEAYIEIAWHYTCWYTRCWCE
jgi:hypothetical protein